jgi:RES domain-containing protein
MKHHPLSQELKALLQESMAGAERMNLVGYRAVPIEFANSRDLISGVGAGRFGGRWTPPGGFATVHASLEPNTALAESLGMQFHYGIVSPWNLP